MTIQNTINGAAVSTGAKASTVFQSLATVVFGVFIIGFVGFSHLEIVHNASHDTRHSNAFPCH